MLRHMKVKQEVQQVELKSIQTISVDNVKIIQKVRVEIICSDF